MMLSCLPGIVTTSEPGQERRESVMTTVGNMKSVGCVTLGMRPGYAERVSLCDINSSVIICILYYYVL